MPCINDIFSLYKKNDIIEVRKIEPPNTTGVTIATLSVEKALFKNITKTEIATPPISAASKPYFELLVVADLKFFAKTIKGSIAEITLVRPDTSVGSALLEAKAPSIIAIE